MEGIALRTPLPPSPQHHKNGQPAPSTTTKPLRVDSSEQNDNLNEKDVKVKVMSSPSHSQSPSSSSSSSVSPSLPPFSPAGESVVSSPASSNATPLVDKDEIKSLASIPRATSNSDLIAEAGKSGESGNATGSTGAGSGRGSSKVGGQPSGSPASSGSPGLLSPADAVGGRGNHANGVPYYNPLSPMSGITPGSSHYNSSPGSFGVPVKSVGFYGIPAGDGAAGGAGGKVRIREDMNIVREVSSIFERQATLGLPEHFPEPVGNPFRPWEDPSMYGYYKHRYGEVTGNFPNNSQNPNAHPPHHQHGQNANLNNGNHNNSNNNNNNGHHSSSPACPPLPGLPKQPHYHTAAAPGMTGSHSSGPRKTNGVLHNSTNSHNSSNHSSNNGTPRNGLGVHPTNGNNSNNTSSGHRDVNGHRASLPLISVPAMAPGFGVVGSFKSKDEKKDEKDAQNKDGAKQKRKIPLAKLWPFGLMSRRHSK